MIALLFAVAAAAALAPAPIEAYPTETKVDYVIGCMAANGQTQDALRRCSCSIDAIASALSYPVYERAETILQMRGATGQAAGVFRDTPVLQEAVSALREAQVEADFRCF